MICPRAPPKDSLITMSRRSTPVSPWARFMVMYGVATIMALMMGPIGEMPSMTSERIAKLTVGTLTMNSSRLFSRRRHHLL